MPGLFDLIQGAMGRPNPIAQLNASFNPASGGPQPGGGGPPGAAAPAQPPAAGAAAGAPQGQGQPQQPQAYQSPPDLMQAYMTLTQRDRAEDQFNRGLALMAASAYPGRRPDLIMNSVPQAQDPGAMFGNLMKMQQWQQQQQRYSDLVNNSDAYAKSFGIDPDMFKATITAAGPQGAGEILGRIAEAQMGITGTQTDKEYRQAVRNFQAANPNKPLPPELQTEAGFAANQAANITTAKTKADDLVADQHNFAPALANYDKGLGLIDQFNTPEMQEGAKEFLGPINSLRPVKTMDAKGRAAWALYTQIMATQFAAGTQDFKGAGRITQSELTQDAPSQSTMSKLDQDPSDFFNGVAKYREQLAQHRANLFGAAQKADDPRLSDADYSKFVAPNMDVFGGPTRTVKATPDGGGGSTAAAAPTGGAGLKPMPDATKKAAQDLLAKDPSQRDALIAHLRGLGLDTTGL